MALIKCPTCGEEISDKAVQCVHCGATLKEENQNKVIIHSYEGVYAVNPKVQVFDGSKQIKELEKGETWEYIPDKDTVLTFHCSIRKTTVPIQKDKTTEITLSFNRGTGVLSAITKVQGEDAVQNQINEINYQNQLKKQENKNTVWFIIGIIASVIALLLILSGN